MACKCFVSVDRSFASSAVSKPPGRRRALPLAIAAALGLGMPVHATAQFNAEVDLLALITGEDTVSGVGFFGESADDSAGYSVSAAGDINGDGIDDLIIGAYAAEPNGRYSGRSYVVFGSASGLPAPFELSSLNGLNGFVLNGEVSGDRFGRSVSTAGDINGDGIDDLIVGAPNADPSGESSGRSYVVFGSASGLPNPFELSSLNGLNGFVLNGEAAGSSSGSSVSAAGDINDDGIDDLIIGAPKAAPNGIYSGRSYVVFGSASGLPNPFELSSLNGMNGFVLNGEAAVDFPDVSVSAAGDINGDGVDDLIVGVRNVDPDGSRPAAGRSYVVFGSAGGGLPNPFELSSLNSLNGFVLDGEAVGDGSGRSVSAAGDINGDGIDDLIVGASAADPDGSRPAAGRSYVVFGSDSGLPNPFELSSLNGLNGFVLNGEAASDLSGRSVSAAGDINGDGIDDLIIGASQADPGMKYSSGRSYVVFGSASGHQGSLNLADLDGSIGFKINGANENERSGHSVSAAGDINGDGVEDLIIGAPFFNITDLPGRAYLIYGRGDFVFSDRFEGD